MKEKYKNKGQQSCNNEKYLNKDALVTKISNKNYADNNTLYDLIGVL